MRTPDEILVDAISNLEKLKRENTVLSEVFELLDQFSSRPFKNWSIDHLSRFAGELSMYLLSLGDLVAEYQLGANSAYMYRKFKSITSFKRLRKEMDTIKDAESEADLEVAEEYERQLVSQYEADALRALYQNCERLVSVIQSRMKHTETERVQANLSDEVMQYEE